MGCDDFKVFEIEGLFANMPETFQSSLLLRTKVDGYACLTYRSPHFLLGAWTSFTLPVDKEEDAIIAKVRDLSGTYDEEFILMPASTAQVSFRTTETYFDIDMSTWGLTPGKKYRMTIEVHSTWAHVLWTSTATAIKVFNFTCIAEGEEANGTADEQLTEDDLWSLANDYGPAAAGGAAAYLASPQEDWIVVLLGAALAWLMAPTIGFFVQDAVDFDIASFWPSDEGGELTAQQVRIVTNVVIGAVIGYIAGWIGSEKMYTAAKSAASSAGGAAVSLAPMLLV